MLKARIANKNNLVTERSIMAQPRKSHQKKSATRLHPGHYQATGGASTGTNHRGNAPFGRRPESRGIIDTRPPSPCPARSCYPEECVKTPLCHDKGCRAAQAR